MARIVVILFLFTFISSRTFSMINLSQGLRGYLTVSKKSSSSPCSRSDVQLYEEKEKEKEGEGENSEGTHFDLYFISLAHELTFSATHEEAHVFLSYHAPPSCGDATDIPVYLAKRAILI